MPLGHGNLPWAKQEHHVVNIGQTDALKEGNRRRQRALVTLLGHLVAQEPTPRAISHIAVTDALKAELPKMLRDVA